jgi:hypothetical protein
MGSVVSSRRQPSAANLENNYPVAEKIGKVQAGGEEKVSLEVGFPPKR